VDIRYIQRLLGLHRNGANLLWPKKAVGHPRRETSQEPHGAYVTKGGHSKRWSVRLLMDNKQLSVLHLTE